MHMRQESCVSIGNRNGESWFVLQVIPQHERKVATLLQCKNCVHFLPLHQVRHRWSDRIKVIEEPLFPGYVFFRSALTAIGSLRSIEGVVRIVSFGRNACVIADEEICALKQVIESKRDVCPTPYLAIGEKVHVITGPMSGITGIITHFNRGSRLVISVDMMMKSISVEIDASEVQQIQQAGYRMSDPELDQVRRSA